jgi:hypothetical protein
MTPLRYVVLRHERIPQPHYDLMFETAPGSTLATWRSADWPITPTTVFVPLSDHRHEYLEYEGPVSNNRGHVRRVAAGSHVVEQNDEQRVVILFENGQRLLLPRSSPA